MSTDNKVNDFLADIQASSPDHYQILQAARQLFHSVSQPVVESIKYGGLIYQRDHEMVGGIFVYKNHLSIEFSNGAQFDDPHGVLEGGGKYRRHIKLADLSDIESKKVGFYVEQTLAKCQ